MTDEIDNMQDAAFKAETEARRRQAVFASDYAELRRNLLAAADRFADLADLIEQDHPDCKHLSFMRESAKRYRRAGNLA